MPKVSKKQAKADEGRGKRKRAAKAKDPNAPKRPTTAFFFFAQTERANIKAANPDMKITEISKELGRLWKDLSEKQKEKFTKMAEKDRTRYENEKAEYEDRAQGQGDDDDDEDDDEED